MTTPTDATIDAVLAVLARGPDGALTLAPGGARTIQATLAAITDPESFQRALADVLGLAGYLGAVRGAPAAARAIIRACEAMSPRLVAIGALPDPSRTEHAERARVLGLTTAPRRPSTPVRVAGPCVAARTLVPRGLVRP